MGKSTPIGVADFSLGVFEEFVSVRMASRVSFVPVFGTGCSIA
jgi:hypothetical protein